MFYVLSGELFVETPDREYEVGVGEAFFVPRGNPQRAVAGERGCKLVAAGAPKSSDSAVIEEECPACGASAGRDYTVEDIGGTRVYVLTCEACGAETDRLFPGPSGED